MLMKNIVVEIVTQLLIFLTYTVSDTYFWFHLQLYVVYISSKSSISCYSFSNM